MLKKRLNNLREKHFFCNSQNFLLLQSCPISCINTFSHFKKTKHPHQSLTTRLQITIEPSKFNLTPISANKLTHWPVSQPNQIHHVKNEEKNERNTNKNLRQIIIIIIKLRSFRARSNRAGGIASAQPPFLRDLRKEMGGSSTAGTDTNYFLLPRIQVCAAEISWLDHANDIGSGFWVKQVGRLSAFN